MIDERHEELAALYALDLLEGQELRDFETRLAADAELARLVRELRESTASLAHTAPAATPPAALRQRILASVSVTAQKSPVATAAAAATPPAASNVIEAPRSLFRWSVVLPLAAAAVFALGAGWLAQMYVSTRSELVLARTDADITHLALKAAQNLLEAERLVETRQLADTKQQLDDAAARIAQAQQNSSATETQLADAAARLATAERSLASYQELVANRDHDLVSARGEVARAHGERDAARRAADEATTRIAALTQQLKTQGDLANFKIAMLASLAQNTSQALAVAVWDPTKQAGLLKVAKLPAPAADKDYQLWVIDDKRADPVNGGVFKVDPRTGEASIEFKTTEPIKAATAFAVSVERKGGVPHHEDGPILLMGK